jgi:hypothetical protein
MGTKKEITQKDHVKKLRIRRFGKTEMDGEDCFKIKTIRFGKN